MYETYGLLFNLLHVVIVIYITCISALTIRTVYRVPGSVFQRSSGGSSIYTVIVEEELPQRSDCWKRDSSTQWLLKESCVYAAIVELYVKNSVYAVIVEREHHLRSDCWKREVSAQWLLKESSIYAVIVELYVESSMYAVIVELYVESSIYTVIVELYVESSI